MDYPVIGNINDVGSSRISDIEEDANGILWMATWRGLLKFNPALGGSSLEFWGANNSIHPGGRSRDLAIAPDGSVWIAVISVTCGEGGLVNYNPNTNVWRYWGYGTTANNWPPLIPFLINVSIQVKPNGGYLVWASYESIVVVFDSDTQLFTQLPNNGTPGDVLKLPANDCVDDLQNLWAIRIASPGIYSLDYKTQTGSWVTPTQPPVTSLINDIWSFKELANFIGSIGGTELPLITASESLETVRVIEAAYRSIDLDSWIEIGAVQDGVFEPRLRQIGTPKVSASS